jgi:hypothetical protein
MNYAIPYGASGYEDRIQTVSEININNQVGQRNLYLLLSSSAGTVSIRALDIVNNGIPNVFVTMQKQIGGVYTLMESSYTDDSGIAQFSIDVGTTYLFTLTKTGYDTTTTTLNPINGETYSIQMASPISTTNTSPYIGLTYNFNPGAGRLKNGTAYNFTFNLTSSYWPITECIFRIVNTSNSAIIQSVNNSGDSTGCYGQINLSTTGLYNIAAQGIITENYTNTLTYEARYNVGEEYEGQYSLMTFLRDITRFNGAGWSSSMLPFIALIIILGITAWATSQYEGTYRGELVGILVWLLFFIFSLAGWFTINTPNMPAEPAWLSQYIIFILVSLVVATMLLVYFVDGRQRA